MSDELNLTPELTLDPSGAAAQAAAAPELTLEPTAAQVAPELTLEPTAPQAPQPDAAAIQARFCIRDSHIHIVNILNSHTALCKIGDQQLMKICARRSGDSLSLQALRCGQAVIRGIHAECLGGPAVHVKHLDISSIGS